MSASSVYFYQFILIFISNAVAQLNTSCTTPNGESATCVSIYNCNVLLEAVSSNDREVIKFLKASQCGFDKHPLVCCGSVDHYTSNVLENKNGNLPGRDTCGTDFGSRLLGGEVALLGEYPWMTLLEYRQTDGTYKISCGGTLVSERYVITAAQCVTGKIHQEQGILEKVRLGEFNTNTTQDCEYQIMDCADDIVTVGIEKVIVHPLYDDNSLNKENDIALIRLNQSVKFTDFILPICLPSSTEKPPIRRLHLSGWGVLEDGKPSVEKRKFQFPENTTEECKPSFEEMGIKLSNKQICTKDRKNIKSCRAWNIGGPLMGFRLINKIPRWYLEGIASIGGALCNMPGSPKIYTLVSEYFDWINENIIA